MVDDVDLPTEEAEMDDVDPGEPVEPLAGLRQTPPTGFLRRVQGRIQRRHLAADTADFSLAGMAFVVLAFLTVLFQAFRPLDRAEGDE